MRRLVACLGFVAIAGGTACREAAPAAQSTAPSRASSSPVKASAPSSAWPQIVSSRVKSKGRVVALGDVHGDMKATRAALRLAGVMDEQGKWTGGQAVVVQTGDILDRGHDEQAIIDLFADLKRQAKDAGGAVYVLNGNHELMNVAGDFRYVTPEGFDDFEDAVDGATLAAPDPLLSRLPQKHRARWKAFRPGGTYAMKMADQPVVLIVDDTVYAHGGVLPHHVAYGIDKMNHQVGQWLRGQGQAPRIVASSNSPVWTRAFSAPGRGAGLGSPRPGQECKLLEQTLASLGVERMVVGHTVQRRINAACGQKVWRIDVGMASHYGGSPQVLSIDGGSVRALGGAG